MPGGNDLPSLRETIDRYGLSAKKSLGQNFLLDLNLTGRIARAAGARDAVVYEVGPGPGGLTRALLAEGAAKVVAVERDERCRAALADLVSAYPERLEVAVGDALVVDETKLFSGPFRIAANLPYNIATALLVKWLTGSWPPPWRSLTLMFQKEVAERICAGPGETGYGRLSVLAGWRTKAKILFEVSRSAFVPPPKVTSAVVRIEPLAEPVAPAELHDLEKVTASAFGHRRKMLRQSLKSLTEDAIGLCAAACIDPTLRAENLSVADFAALARIWRSVTGSPRE
jgi:16S rRNA (adenine1518-N6/adenine1519-N6)-dimethyltransferase